MTPLRSLTLELSELRSRCSSDVKDIQVDVANDAGKSLLFAVFVNFYVMLSHQESMMTNEFTERMTLP